jgi:hypothetical protein
VVKAGLLAKGMVPTESHHLMLKKTVDGVTEVITRMSHDDKEISGGLAKLMAHQCYLHAAEFWDLIDCPLSQEDWEKLIKQRCVNGRNPFLGH